VSRGKPILTVMSRAPSTDRNTKRSFVATPHDLSHDSYLLLRGVIATAVAMCGSLRAGRRHVESRLPTRGGCCGLAGHAVPGSWYAGSGGSPGCCGPLARRHPPGLGPGLFPAWTRHPDPRSALFGSGAILDGYSVPEVGSTRSASRRHASCASAGRSLTWPAMERAAS
jgi:hypothetical protein